MKTFKYWKDLHESEKLEEFSTNQEGLLWLKTKSIVRKEIIEEFLTANNIKLGSTSLNDQFVELFDILIKNVENSHKLLDKYIISKNKLLLSELDEKQLVSELYKLKSFDWGGDYNNSLDKYLVSHYVKAIKSYDTLVSKFDTEIKAAVQGYVLNSWYNHWSSILIEHIFKSHDSVLPTVGQIKHVDFFIGKVPFDLKVTYLPAEYIKNKRKEMGFPVELTYLKSSAKKLGIDFSKSSTNGDVYYEITEKLKDKGTPDCLKVLKKIKDENMSILEQAQSNPHLLAKWLYENQGEMRFGSENRLFLVLVDTDDFSGSWKLKRNMDLLKPAIKTYLDNFKSKKISDLKINFEFKGKVGTFTTLTDVVFIIKKN
ncbi:MAG: hypothetical protein GX638_11105 [Crenarchaeota archaeon]|nr:hypothetical protein [Thermoproteota archaeon]